MDPVLRAALTSWDWRIEIILLLATAGILYSWGWWRLRQRTTISTNPWQAAALWRPVVYWTGLLILGLALLSPIDVLSSHLLFMHMIQHLLLIMFVPPLLLIANPLPFLLWGLPASVRRQASLLLARRSGFRHLLQEMTKPGLVWLYFLIAFWGWHDPNLYGLALSSAFFHDLEHITFFGTAMLFWWQVIGAGPKIRRPFTPLVRAGFVISAIPATMLAGIAISFSSEPLYAHYELMPRLWGFSVLEDQQLAGVIMWVVGSMMYILAALILVARWLNEEEAKPALPESTWATEEALIAPGLDNSTK